MTQCLESGCRGTIAADGYCDTCGTRHVPTSAPPVETAPSAEALTAAGGLCGRAGCTGRIAADGYCDTCGLAASVVSTGTASSGGDSGSGKASSLVTAPALAAPAAPTTSTRVASGDRSVPRTRQMVSTSVRTASSRTAVGAGLVWVKATPIGDPAAAVLSAEEIEAELGEVPEEERFCSACGRPVGRGSDGKPGRLKGFCGSCRAQFDFVTNEPALQAGEMVAGQYEIVGALAHGGMGWVYLGADRAVSDRWVVLKGLLNENDPDAVMAAVAERRFLAEIEHANIVNIYNFVTHRGAGYIVMEMVGGESLNSKLKSRRASNGGIPNPLGVTEAIAYILGILPAFGYLHDRGLVYNDLKPANIMAVGDEVKLIDLGAVMRVDDHQAAIFGTPGFQAPEMATDGPSIASDLYTVGRTLAVLTLSFVFHQGPYENALPPIEEAPILGQWESFHRFLLRATAAHPDDRFQSAAEMAEQLTGVLREIVALSEGKPRPFASQIFEGDQLVELLVSHEANSDVAGQLVGASWRVLPATRIDETDPAAPFLLGLPEGDPARAAFVLRRGITEGQTEPTAEVLLRLAWEEIKVLEGGAFAPGAEVNYDPENHLARVAAMNPWDWRVDWYRSLNSMRIGQPVHAAEGFSRVWTELPGETAPKLAVALAAEAAGEHARALSLYEMVIGADSSYVSAAFGLARSNRSLANHKGVVEAYNRVPTSSAAHSSAQTAAVRALVGGGLTGEPGLPELMQASAMVDKLQVDAEIRAGLTCDIFERALDGLHNGRIKAQPGQVLGVELKERSLRRALEDAYRVRARLTGSDIQRVRFVELANAVRPRSLF